ncbi:glycosyltransferase family 4 protein [Specibacter sp. NPDC078692]|uniref:glycosyltransferase family 4 protein n=1 Tax=Specibacter sp. NPDC078692 TaxID=3155818 RepID=UPI0034462744
MRILVCPHEMVMGGSQINAIEFASKIKNHGHEAVIYAPSGILVDYARSLGLQVIESPDASSKLELKWMLGLMKIVKNHQIDLIHTYEWGPSTAAMFSAHLLQATPMLMTVLSMEVPEFLPTHIPIVVGTKELYEKQIEKRPAVLMEPVIDLTINYPQDQAQARKSLEIAMDDFVVSIVCRLTTELEKAQGVLRAIAVAGELAARIPMRLIIAGDGPILAEVTDQANAINKQVGREVVIITGNLTDPSPVYACSDVSVGMGSSAIKGMAFGKPLIVQGAGGYWKLLTQETYPEFLDHGWYGKNGGGDDDLKRSLVALAKSPQYIHELGLFGRQIVESRYNIESAAIELANLYNQTRSCSSVQTLRSFKSLKSIAISTMRITKYKSVVLTRRAFNKLKRLSGLKSDSP